MSNTSRLIAGSQEMMAAMISHRTRTNIPLTQEAEEEAGPLIHLAVRHPIYQSLKATLEAHLINKWFMKINQQHHF